MRRGPQRVDKRPQGATTHSHPTAENSQVHAGYCAFALCIQYIWWAKERRTILWPHWQKYASKLSIKKCSAREFEPVYRTKRFAVVYRLVLVATTEPSSEGGTRERRPRLVQPHCVVRSLCERPSRLELRSATAPGNSRTRTSGHSPARKQARLAHSLPRAARGATSASSQKSILSPTPTHWRALDPALDRRL